MEKTGLLDRMIEHISPAHAIKRAAARKALAFLNSGYGNYGANSTKKSMRGWMYYGGSAKEDIEDNLDVLRQRSRDAYMGVPVAASALKTMCTNVIAGGLMPVPQIDLEILRMTDGQAEDMQTQITREFDLWADATSCDAERMDDFYGLQKLAYLGTLMNGDAFVLIQRRELPGQPYKLCLRVIEADRVCSPDGYDRLEPCIVYGHCVQRIVQGVETDETGTVKAYWICSGHPLAHESTAQAWRQWTRVEAYGRETGRRNVLHIMTRERAGQVRGVPMLAPVLEALKELGRYTDAEVTNAVLSAYFTVFIQSANISDGIPIGEMLPPEELIDAEDEGTIEMGPGAILKLKPGENVQFADPKHPNSGYDVFTSAMIGQIGAALEIPPEVLNKKFTTTFSSARAALNEFWRVCEMRREAFVTDFCQPVYEEWMAEAVALGRIHAPGFFGDAAVRKAYTSCTWNGPARTALNPIQEVNAAKMRVEAGFSTAQDETAQLTGKDYSRNMRQRVMEAKRKRAVDEVVNPAPLQEEKEKRAESAPLSNQYFNPRSS